MKLLKKIWNWIKSSIFGKPVELTPSTVKIDSKRGTMVLGIISRGKWKFVIPKEQRVGVKVTPVEGKGDDRIVIDFGDFE